jgi:lipopolysaccharide transport system permease protein
MDRFSAVEAHAEGATVRLRFEIDQPGVIGWQLYDPSTGAFLPRRRMVGITRLGRRSADSGACGGWSLSDPSSSRRRSRALHFDPSHGGIRKAGDRSTLRFGRRERAACPFSASDPTAFVYPVRSMWRNRRLIGSMVKRDMLARYRGSLGGTLWTLLNPLLLMATYFFVFGIVMKTRLAGDTSSRGFLVYFLAGMLPWLAFSEAVARSPFVILEYRSFVKKVVFPLETLPVNLVIAGLFTELIGLAILLAVQGVPLALVWLPALLVPQLLLTVGLCWILAAAGVFVRDLGQITGFVLTAWFFLTPICYVESPEFEPLFRFNPILVLVRGYRAVFLENHAPSLQGLAVAVDRVSLNGDCRVRLVPPPAENVRRRNLARRARSQLARSTL